MTIFAKTKQLVPMLRQINSVCIVKLYLYEINFNIICPSMIRSNFEVFWPKSCSSVWSRRCLQHVQTILSFFNCSTKL